jgi:hypothetical protein
LLDPTRSEPFEIGASLLSILAFPGPAEEGARKGAADALCAEALRKTIAADPEHAVEWRAAYPGYTAIDASESRRRLRTLARRLRDRMIASRMSLGFLQEALAKQPARLPASMSRLSINELSKLVLDQSGESDPENVEKRVWRQSLPVIHLAAAMQIVARAMGADLERYGYVLDNAPLHAAVIYLAQVYEHIVFSDPRFGKRRDQLIRIRGNDKSRSRRF